MDAFSSFCQAVCAHIRWKRAHAGVTAELTAHLEDHASALEAQGMDPDQAALQAVASMGDPADIGHGLDRVYAPLLYWVERVLGWAWRCTLAVLVWVLFWNLATSGIGLPNPSTAQQKQDDAMYQVLEQLTGVERLDIEGAAHSWYSGRFGRLDHALLITTTCYLYPEAGGDTYRFAFRQLNLSANPFLDSAFLGDPEECFTLTDELGTAYSTDCFYDAISCTGVPRSARAITVHYSFLGRTCQWTIPLNWGEEL